MSQVGEAWLREREGMRPRAAERMICAEDHTQNVNLDLARDIQIYIGTVY
jgi:hypothetical protein